MKETPNPFPLKEGFTLTQELADLLNNVYHYKEIRAMVSDERNADLQLHNVIADRGLGAKIIQVDTGEMSQQARILFIGPGEVIAKRVWDTKTYNLLHWATNPGMIGEVEDYSSRNNNWDEVTHLRVKALRCKVHGDYWERDRQRTINMYKKSPLGKNISEDQWDTVFEDSTVNENRAKEQEFLSQLPQGVGHLTPQEVYNMLSSEVDNIFEELRKMSQ
jgi:hypothetical protein